VTSGGLSEIYPLTESLLTRCSELLTDLGLYRPGDSIEAVPLTGGVASDIAKVILADRTLCVKFALPKLKVQADWRAPVHRNAAEYAWLQVAAAVEPQSALQLFGRSEKLHGFAMEFIAGDSAYLWKRELLAQAQDHDEAAKVGDLLGRIHAASAADGFDAGAFDNHDDFHALRLDPYLVYTAGQHPAIAKQIEQMVAEQYQASQVLVHGDVSPKNIMFRDGQAILLDAECATMGDASFDPSFCLNHLVLKAIHLPASTRRYLASAEALWRSYSACVNWEPAATLEARVCRLLPALMLARVDGKSPVEYLTVGQQDIVRQIALAFIQSPHTSVTELLQGIGVRIEELTS
jgi:aminoglycoside phosphotransferase (APT) family kinase protein